MHFLHLNRLHIHTTIIKKNFFMTIPQALLACFIFRSSSAERRCNEPLLTTALLLCFVADIYISHAICSHQLNLKARYSGS